MSKHKGLRLSVLGAVIFFASLLLLLVLPKVVPLTGLLLGGMLVWAGLMWTLFGYYAPPEGPTSAP